MIKSGQRIKDRLMEKKKLEIGKTKIGERTGEYGGRLAVLSVYYGNHVEPMMEGDFVHFNQKDYEKMLENFLNSKEGSEYERPTVKEMRDAEVIVVGSEVSFLKKKYSVEGDFDIVKLKPERMVDEEGLARTKSYYTKVKIMKLLLEVVLLMAGAVLIISHLPILIKLGAFSLLAIANIILTAVFVKYKSYEFFEVDEEERPFEYREEEMVYRPADESMEGGDAFTETPTEAPIEEPIEDVPVKIEESTPAPEAAEEKVKAELPESIFSKVKRQKARLCRLTLLEAGTLQNIFSYELNFGDKEEFTVGGRETADIVIRGERTVSGTHLSISAEAEGYSIMDVSTNGTEISVIPYTEGQNIYFAKLQTGRREPLIDKTVIRLAQKVMLMFEVIS